MPVYSGRWRKPRTSFGWSTSPSISPAATSNAEKGTQMIRTGDEYRESIRDGRQVWIDGERVADVTTHPMFKPLVDVRARIFEMAHDEASAETMTYLDPDTGERNAIGLKPPRT